MNLAQKRLLQSSLLPSNPSLPLKKSANKGEQEDDVTDVTGAHCMDSSYKILVGAPLK